MIPFCNKFILFPLPFSSTTINEENNKYLIKMTCTCKLVFKGGQPVFKDKHTLSTPTELGTHKLTSQHPHYKVASNIANKKIYNFSLIVSKLFLECIRIRWTNVKPIKKILTIESN